MTNSIVRALQNNRILMFTASEKQYREALTEVALQTQNLFSNIAVFSYRTPSSVLETQLNKAGINVKNCFFVDVLTANVKKTSESKNTLFIQSPTDLNELGLAISELLKTGKFQAIIFDSPGAMLLYQEYETVLQFLHNLITKCRVANVQLTLFTVEFSTNKELIRDLHLFVDDVIDLGAPAVEEKLAEAFQ